MRSTVLVTDILVYIPAIFLFTYIWQANRSTKTQVCGLSVQFWASCSYIPPQHVALLTLLLQPALIIVDSGHFQYNSVMLGASSITSTSKSTDQTTCRIYLAGDELLCNRSRSPWCRLFRPQSRVQTNGTVLCSCHRLIPHCKMCIPRSH